MNISMSLACKIGSIVVHLEECFIEDRGHPLDLEALRPLLADSEVREWLAMMNEQALLPKKRSES